ncbi:cell division protein SepF [Geodermatophilus sp. FMUSA9-8]|uniref:cell division protein SepF n=1 Tax=Geodermatophilus sp. FMUSA9-8 TaxID=3120155 RepID=UPI003FA59AF9
MAGAMKKMGIYLGLVEDDDARAYGRYDARQSDHHDRYDDGYDGRYDDGRYDDARYDDRRPARAEGRYEGRYDDRYAGGTGYYDSLTGDPGYDERHADRHHDDRHDDRRDDRHRDERPEPALAPEPAVLRRGGATRLGLATPPPAGVASGPVPAAAEVRTASPAGARLGTVGGAGTVGGGQAGASAGLAAREAVAVAEPAPEPVKQPYRITTLCPKTYNEARAIGEAFREGSPVIMNLTDLDHADARRLVDFAAGLIFGLRGSIEPVTAKVFLLSPRDVDVTAEDKARIREGGFSPES